MPRLVKKGSLTTCLTTDSAGALGNSGYKSAKERGFPSGKGQKKLFLAEIAFIGPFGSRGSQVQILSPRPYRVFIRDLTYEHSFCLSFLVVHLT